LNVSFKKYRDTRWSTKKHAVNAAYRELPMVITVLEELVEMKKNKEMYQGAKSLLRQMR